jgi:Flp pilus assembly protein TadD
LGEIKNAVDYFKKAIEIDPNNVNSYYNLGAIHYDVKKFKEAKTYLEKTVELQPNFALPYFVLGNLHAELKDYENAISNYNKAIKINKNLAAAYNNLGLVYRNINNFENAISSYENAIAIKKDHVNAYHNLALVLKDVGKFESAIQAHEKAIKYEPENLAHYFYLSDLKNNILDINFKNKIEKIISKKNSQKINIAYGNFLLAKYEQKIKNYEKELNYLTEGHKYFYESKKNKFELLVRYSFRDMLQISEDAKVEGLVKNESKKIKPIFIIGVPRCGSTLVEKIIGSGEKFIAMGEETSILEEFVTAKILKKQSLNLGNAENVRDEILDIYLKKGLVLEKYDNTFTDKSLNNFFYLKLIKEIFPNAKIINCKRDVLSSIMSIFQNNLTEIAWAHDLNNIFKYIDNYLQTIETYNLQDPNFIYGLEYEKLINNPEEESKKLMEFCGLAWSKKCLEFYKREDIFSKTTSNVQIRQAVYKHSLDKYLPYKKMLDKYGKKYPWFN